MMVPGQSYQHIHNMTSNNKNTLYFRVIRGCDVYFIGEFLVSNESLFIFFAMRKISNSRHMNANNVI